MPSARRRIPEVVVLEVPRFEDGGGECVGLIRSGSSSTQFAERGVSRVASICPADDDNQRRNEEKKPSIATREGVSGL